LFEGGAAFEDRREQDMKVFGSSSCPECKRLQDLLYSKHIDHEYIDAETPDGMADLIMCHPTFNPRDSFPICITTSEERKSLYSVLSDTEKDIMIVCI